MFRLQENVPEVYVKQSRDFQLFCRLYDVINNSIRFNAKSTSSLLSPLHISDKMLPLLATRIGFFPKNEYSSEALREILSAFPYIVKYKGSKQGIEMALNVILKIENNYKESMVTIDRENCVVRIFTQTRILGESLLRDLLSYIIPIGYEIEVSTFIRSDLTDTPSQLKVNIKEVDASIQNSGISIVYNKDNNNYLKTDEESEGDALSKKVIGSYTVTKVLGVDEL